MDESQLRKTHDAHNENELEISDLPGTEGERRHHEERLLSFTHITHSLAARPQLRRRVWQAGTAGGALLLIVFVLFGSFPQIGQGVQHLFERTPPATELPVHTASHAEQLSSIDIQGIISQFHAHKVIFWEASTPPVVPLDSTLAEAPQNCLYSTTLSNFATPLYPPSVGSSPVWVTGFTGPGALLNHLSRAPRPHDGWYAPLLIVSETNFAGDIILRAGIVSSSFPLWFSKQYGGSLVRTVTLHPLDPSLSNHTTGDQQWSATLVYLYIPQAGCYYLDASWNGGSWVAYFAAGR
ncbi:MAG TPA: hypothetical protein VKT25_09110 [Ktedonobacteraceae bacterium]|nr:hypothetical protein [Ktedonobacteraceae bacterium]